MDKRHNSKFKIISKVLNRVNKKQEEGMVWVEELQKFFEGIDLDLYNDDDNQTMYLIKDSMH